MSSRLPADRGQQPEWQRQRAGGPFPCHREVGLAQGGLEVGDDGVVSAGLDDHRDVDAFQPRCRLRIFRASAHAARKMIRIAYVAA